MKGRTLGAAAVSFMLLCVCFLGSTKSPHTGGSSQGQERATRRTLIGRQEEVELLDSEVSQQDTNGTSQEDSFYLPWIQQDFAVWQEEGIKQVRGYLPSAAFAVVSYLKSIQQCQKLKWCIPPAELGGRDGHAVPGMFWGGLQVSGHQWHTLGGSHI